MQEAILAASERWRPGGRDVFGVRRHSWRDQARERTLRMFFMIAEAPSATPTRIDSVEYGLRSTNIPWQLKAFCVA